MHLHNCRCFQEHLRMLLQSLRKKRRNCDRRAMRNATRGIDTGRGVILHRGVSDGSDGARPLWRSHSARTEMFFADLFSIVFSLILLWTFAAFPTFATLLCKDQSFRSEPIYSIDCSFHLDELCDDLIRPGGHHAIFVHHELEEDSPLIIPSDPAIDIEDVLLLTHLGDCLCMCVGVGVSGISASGRCCCRSCTEIVIVDSPINPQCIGVDIPTVV